MPFIHSIETAFPKNYFSQKDLFNHLHSHWKEKFYNSSRIETIHKNVQVKGRHLALDPNKYFELKGFEDKNAAFIDKALDLCTQAVRDLIEKTKINPKEITALISNTVTGFSIPSLEARLMNRIEFSPQTKRIPIMGLGCLAGVAGLNRAMDYLKGHPGEAIIFFSVELCSLTLQLEDISMANIISSGLFGDGAAAVLCVGDEHPLVASSKLKFKDSYSSFYPNSERVMGWDITDTGLKIILSQDVPKVCRELVPPDIKALLDRNNISLKDLGFHLAHPGGPKVLSAMEEALGLENMALTHSWNSLSEKGNMSSVSILDISKRTFEKEDHSGELGIMVALGPAFCSEIGLYQWIN